MVKRNNIIVFSAAIFLTIAIITINLPLDKEIVPVRFTLGEKTGFDIAPGELSFGKIEVNQSATRDILIENNFDRPVKISIKSSGEISDHIIVSENNFRLNPQESKNITFSVYTKGLTEFREYNGEIEIISKKT